MTLEFYPLLWEFGDYLDSHVLPNELFRLDHQAKKFVSRCFSESLSDSPQLNKYLQLIQQMFIQNGACIHSTIKKSAKKSQAVTCTKFYLSEVWSDILRKDPFDSDFSLSDTDSEIEYDLEKCLHSGPKSKLTPKNKKQLEEKLLANKKKNTNKLVENFRTKKTIGVLGFRLMKLLQSKQYSRENLSEKTEFSKQRVCTVLSVYKTLNLVVEDPKTNLLYWDNEQSLLIPDLQKYIKNLILVKNYRRKLAKKVLHLSTKMRQKYRNKGEYRSKCDDVIKLIQKKISQSLAKTSIDLKLKEYPKDILDKIQKIKHKLRQFRKRRVHFEKVDSKKELKRLLNQSFAKILKNSKHKSKSKSKKKKRKGKSKININDDDDEGDVDDDNNNDNDNNNKRKKKDKNNGKKKHSKNKKKKIKATSKSKKKKKRIKKLSTRKKFAKKSKKIKTFSGYELYPKNSKSFQDYSDFRKKRERKKRERIERKKLKEKQVNAIGFNKRSKNRTKKLKAKKKKKKHSKKKSAQNLISSSDSILDTFSDSTLSTFSGSLSDTFSDSFTVSLSESFSDSFPDIKFSSLKKKRLGSIANSEDPKEFDKNDNISNKVERKKKEIREDEDESEDLYTSNSEEDNDHGQGKKKKFNKELVFDKNENNKLIEEFKINTLNEKLNETKTIQQSTPNNKQKKKRNKKEIEEEEDDDEDDDEEGEVKREKGGGRHHDGNGNIYEYNNCKDTYQVDVTVDIYLDEKHHHNYQLTKRLLQNQTNQCKLENALSPTIPIDSQNLFSKSENIESYNPESGFYHSDLFESPVTSFYSLPNKSENKNKNKNKNKNGNGNGKESGSRSGNGNDNDNENESLLLHELNYNENGKEKGKKFTQLSLASSMEKMLFDNPNLNEKKKFHSLTKLIDCEKDDNNDKI
ncbi:serine/threonine-protein phosphatase 1 regulatory subunit [Anaeramoeba flamelloides]|uniref:Serine/threonine-protein phosphatase 1 regulatory subunit n=1 Tax=Anaeramoeba flamelloides TaxID=1746091 RepID=A0AAV7ZGC8_9EUKA|nr:serine/threonine-protein phosphatase 1 regulatory subunit [Anaeramoeba flamelloides]